MKTATPNERVQALLTGLLNEFMAPLQDRIKFSKTSPTKSSKATTSVSKRRGKSEITAIKNALREALADYNPMTVRQVFYQMVSRGVIQKNENEYKNTVCRLLAEMRRSGEIPYGWIADNTRWMRKPTTYSSMENMLSITAQTYRRAIWDNQDAYVEIWLEKDALAGVLIEETRPWDVLLMVTRGYASLTYLHEAALTIKAQRKPAYLYYFGDYDPSGVDIPRKVESDLRELTGYDSEIHFERVAVTPAQILEFQLPTRPTKPGDSRSKNFYDESVEVDAIPPMQLREIVRDCIVWHVDQGVYERTMEIERQELETLTRVYQNWQVIEDFVSQG
jgi:hypothetical protein